MPTGKRPQPPPGTCRVSLSGTYLTHKWASIFWLQLTSAAPAQADLQLLAAKISTAWTANIRQQSSIGTSLTEVLLVWTPTAGSEIFAVDSTVSVGSHVGGDLSSAASCYVINHRTGAYYRGGHSRSMIPGIPLSTVSNGSTINNTQREAMRSAWSAFCDAINTGPAGAINGALAGVVRFQSGDAWMNPPVFIKWQSHSIRPTVGTLKARLTE